MRCDEIQERFVDLLYTEIGTPQASPELRAHIASCPTCRKELDALQGVRRQLKAWEDETPPMQVVVPAVARRRRTSGFAILPVLRYAGVTVLFILAVLSLTNAEITWNKQGFSYRSRVFASRGQTGDYYTKAEVRDILKRVLDDSEARMTDLNYLMIQRMMDTVEQEHMQEMRYVRNFPNRDGGKN